MLSKEEIVLIIYFILVILFLAIFTVVFFITYQRRKNNLLQEKFEAERNFKEELSTVKIEIQEATLKNVSWELHDNIGQLLSIASMQLNIMAKDPVVTGNPGLIEVKTLVTDSLTEVRALSKSLNQEVIDYQGLIKSVENELDRLNRIDILEAHFKIEGDPFEIPASSTIILFRILQEFFNNVLKHSGASELRVEFKYINEILHISAQDNGKGFDREHMESGSGLFNMQSRAAMIKAEFNLNSSLGGGTSLYLKYPNQE